MNRFIKENGSVVCRELLGLDLSKPDEMAIIREQDLFHTKCPEMIRSAADILDELLKEYKNQQNIKTIYFYESHSLVRTEKRKNIV